MIIYEKLMSGNYSDRFDSAGGAITSGCFLFQIFNGLI